MQIAIEFDDSFEAESGSTVSWCTVLERVDVVLDGLDWDFKKLGARGEHIRVVNTLSTTSNLFAPHKEVVRVRVVGVVWVQHSVEWADCGWIPIKHIKVSVILFLDKFSKCLLRLG